MELTNRALFEYEICLSGFMCFMMAGGIGGAPAQMILNYGGSKDEFMAIIGCGGYYIRGQLCLNNFET